MVLKFFETLSAVSKYIEKEENEKGVKYIRQRVVKSFGSESEFAWRRRYRKTSPPEITPQDLSLIHI